MKNPIALLIALATGACVQAAQIEWRAILAMGDKTYFSVGTTDGTKNAWVSPGAQFEGFRIVGTDATGKKLSVEKEGETLILELVTARIDEGEASLQAEELMRTLRFREMLDESIAQQRQGVRKMMESMFANQQMPQANLEAVIKAQEELLDEVFDEEFVQEMTRVYAEVFTANELKAMTNFYASRDGQAFLSKQPVLMEKMMAVMQPKLLAAMPKIQSRMMETIVPTEPPPTVP